MTETEIQLKAVRKEENKARKVLDKIIKNRLKLQLKIAEEKYSSMFDGKMTIKNLMSINPHEILGDNLYYKYQRQCERLCGESCSVDGLVRLHQNNYKKCLPNIRIEFDQNKTFEEQLRILDFIPHLPRIDVSNLMVDDVKIAKYISVFEHQLSEFGMWNMLIAKIEDKEVGLLLLTRYGRTTEEKRGTVKEILQHVYDCLPYKQKGDE